GIQHRTTSLRILTLKPARSWPCRLNPAKTTVLCGLAWMPIQKKKPNKMANTHNDTSILTTLVFDFTPRSSRGDSVRPPEYEPQPLAPQPGDDRLCRIETGRDEQGVMGTLLIPHHDVRLGHLHLGRGIHEVLEQMPRLGLFVAPADAAGQQEGQLLMTQVGDRHLAQQAVVISQSDPAIEDLRMVVLVRDTLQLHRAPQ